MTSSYYLSIKYGLFDTLVLSASLGSRNGYLFDSQFASTLPRRFATLSLVLSKIEYFAVLAYMTKLEFSNQFSLQYGVSATNYRRHTYLGPDMGG